MYGAPRGRFWRCALPRSADTTPALESSVSSKLDDNSRPHVRRPRYPGRNPRTFHQKYKELQPERYASEVQKVIESGKTPAGTHLPIMVDEVLTCTRPGPGDVVVDCTVGGGGHTRRLLECVQPGGRVIGLDVDPIELPRTEANLRAAGFGSDVLVMRHSNFAGLPRVLAADGVSSVDVIFADLGVSSMQIDNPDRGFSYKQDGPLDMRMNPARGESAAALVTRVDAAPLAEILTANADEPFADIIAERLTRLKPATTQEAARAVRDVLVEAQPRLSSDDITMSVRRTFQALRIEVNAELSTLDALLRAVPLWLAPGGRVAFLTFHSGEDRRVKKSFQSGQREGVYSDVAAEAARPTPREIGANPRAGSAKLRWAVRA
jgi:16S rRNA (cytosine1402-N4)-methyltransferase